MFTFNSVCVHSNVTQPIKLLPYVCKDDVQWTITMHEDKMNTNHIILPYLCGYNS